MSEDNDFTVIQLPDDIDDSEMDNEAYPYKMGDPEYNAFEDPESPFFGLTWKGEPGWRGPTSNRPLPTVRCTRIKKNGEQCKNRSIRGLGLDGGRGVCRIHGGQLPSVKAHANKIVQAARMELLNSVPDAVSQIVGLVQNSNDEKIILAAAKEVLDRAGVRGGVEIQVDVNQGASPSEVLWEKLSEMRGGEQKAIEDAEVVE